MYSVLLDAPDQPVSRIQIAKLGEFDSSKYGQFSISRKDVKQWGKNLSHLPGQRALIDLDHQADRTPRNTEAAGWITGIDLEGDTPKATIEWTPVGRQAIEEKRYLFFSPTYGAHTDENGVTHKNTLIGGALTNRPFLNMPAVTLASDERLSQARATVVEEYELTILDVSAGERKLAVKEGNALPDGSYPIRNTAQLHAAAVLAASGHGNAAAAKKLIRRRAKELGVSLSSLPGMGGGGSDSRAHDMETADLIKVLDLPEDADEAQILKRVKKLTKADGQRDVKTLEAEANEQGLKLLDEKTYKNLKRDAAAGAGAAAELKQNRFETAFGTALKEGRALEAQRDSYAKFYELDADETLKQLAEMPPVLNVKPSGWNNGDVTGEKQDLNTLTQAKMKDLNLPYDEAYLKVLDDVDAGMVKL